MKSKLYNQAAIENAASVCEQDAADAIAAGCTIDTAPPVGDSNSLAAVENAVEVLDDEAAGDLAAGCTQDNVNV